MKYIKQFESNVPGAYDDLLKFRNDFKDKLYNVNSIDMDEIKEVILPLLDEIGEHKYITTEYLTNEYHDIQINDSDDIENIRFSLRRLNDFLKNKGLEDVRGGWRVVFQVNGGKVEEDGRFEKSRPEIQKEFEFVKKRLNSIGYFANMKIVNKTMKLDNEWSEWYIIDIEIWLEDFKTFDIEMPYHSKIPNIIIKDFDTFVRNKKLTEEDTEQLINMINKVRDSNNK